MIKRFPQNIPSFNSSDTQCSEMCFSASLLPSPKRTLHPRNSAVFFKHRIHRSCSAPWHVLLWLWCSSCSPMNYFNIMLSLMPSLCQILGPSLLLPLASNITNKLSSNTFIALYWNHWLIDLFYWRYLTLFSSPLLGASKITKVELKKCYRHLPYMWPILVFPLYYI